MTRQEALSEAYSLAVRCSQEWLVEGAKATRIGDTAFAERCLSEARRKQGDAEWYRDRIDASNMVP